MPIALTVAYDGTKFHGFQRQREEPTVQSVLEESLRRVNDGPTGIRGAGRTDAGVHALGQVVSFEPRVAIPLHRWPRALNGSLPRGIWVRDARWAPEGFRPVEWSTWKHYRYCMRTDDTGLPFLSEFCWYLFRPLDVGEMSRACAFLAGRRDFAAFQVTGRPVKSTVRTMYRIETNCIGGLVTVDFVADGFLYKMARSIAGTLAEIGKGTMTIEEMMAAQELGDRSRMGPTAPGHGLFLVSVGYPQGTLYHDD